tara:strand:- start:101 stop:517 length:417 start_codon:yes stop_codon:yes gene_type:complete
MLKLSHLLEFDTSENEYWEHHGIRDKIKKHLMDYEGFSTWKEYVDSCELGGCQYTAHAIVDAFGGSNPEVVGVFGEIETDEGRDPDGGYITHHWVEIEGNPYDFAKGTLGDYINWNDKYDDDVGLDDWRYHPIHKKKN